MTRTVFRAAKAEERRIYEAVLEARERGAPWPRRELRKWTRRSQRVAQGGLAEAFTHSTGHGVGLEIHEQPRLRWTGDKVAAGMVITIEPGVYLAGKFGIRIEDMGL